MQKCSGNPEHTVRLFEVMQHEAKDSDVIASTWKVRGNLGDYEVASPMHASQWRDN